MRTGFGYFFPGLKYVSIFYIFISLKIIFYIFISKSHKSNLKKLNSLYASVELATN